jgi:hypothetical protein
VNWTLIEKCEDYIKYIKEMKHCGTRRLYELDSIRAEIHRELCAILRVDKRTTQNVTDYLDEIDYDIKELYIRLLKLIPINGDNTELRYR